MEAAWDKLDDAEAGNLSDEDDVANPGAPLDDVIIDEQPARPDPDVKASRREERRYMLSSIFVSLCCCFVCGLASLVTGTKATNRQLRGDKSGYKRCMLATKILLALGIIFGLVLWITMPVVLVAVVETSSSNQ